MSDVAQSDPIPTSPIVPRWIRRFRMAMRVVAVLVLVAIVIVACWFGFIFYFISGDIPRVSAGDYDSVLTHYAQGMMPDIQKLRQYYQIHGNFPDEAAGVPKENYEILRGGQAFQLRCDIRDAALFYDGLGTTGFWIYDPGDGSPARKVLLSP